MLLALAWLLLVVWLRHVKTPLVARRLSLTASLSVRHPAQVRLFT